jgi:phosphomevalonate kinase
VAATRRLLAVSGKRFSGKDTFAAALVEHARRRGVELGTYAFAGESKRLFAAEEARRGGEVDLARLQADRAYKEAWRPRLTAFTVAAIAADPLVFCREVARRVEASSGPSVITDLRLRLELDHLRPRFALHVVRITRTDEQRSASGWRRDPAADDHHTETELDDPALWDEVVPNDGALADLDAAAARVLSAWLG